MHLFKKLGPTFMSKMKGAFAFVVYDAQLGRVLAVCDRLATFPMLQGHLHEDGSLVVACGAHAGEDLPMGDVTKIGAGEFKFGWRSEPSVYMASTDVVMKRCEEARSAAMEALMVCLASAARAAGVPPAVSGCVL